MIFLNPAVLFGLLAASIPVLIHLLNLKKLKKIEFSTLSFLKELQKTKIRRIKLKQWLLLALRILIILLIVFAFARPTVKSISIGGTTSAAKTTAVIILDNSFSMSVITAKGSYFNQAKQAAKNILEQFQEGDEVALLLTSGNDPSSMRTTTDLTTIKKELDDAQISYVSKPLNNSIVTAAQILGSSQNFNKEVYILSDLQKDRLTNDKSEISDLNKMFGKNTRLYTIHFDKKDITNLAVTDFEPANQIFEINKPISFSATVTNFSSLPVENSVASLFINGSRGAQQSISLNPGESTRLSFETNLKTTGLLDIFVELEDDDILQDNRRYYQIYVPEKISIALFTDNPGDAKFVKLALQGTESSETITISERGLSQISILNSEDFDAVIIIGSESITDYQALNNYIDKGGSVLIMPGSGSSLMKFKQLCAQLNLPQPEISAGKINDNRSPVLFDKVDLQHPIFNNLFDQKDKTKVEPAEVYYYFKIVPGGRGLNIISLADNSSFFSEYRTAKGKILLFASAPDLGWNNFPLKALFAPLITKSVFYMTSKIKEGESAIAGNDELINIGKAVVPQIKIERPDNSTEIINTDSLHNKDYLTYRNTNLAGNYKFFSGDNLIDYASVNTEPLESNPAELSNSEFEDYLKQINFEGKYFSVSPGDNIQNIIYQARFGSELWRFFLTIALILAIIEMIIARSTKKDLVDVKE